MENNIELFHGGAIAVERPMADDTIWNYIEDYIDGEITREAFWVLVNLNI